MIKIGDFSKLAHISVKTLHHYGSLGLLEPIHVDRYTGYRYYELEQLQDLNRILALKDLGFSLEQIAQLINEDLSIQELRGMLRMKQLDLSAKLQDEQARLDRVEYRLKQLEDQSHLPVMDIAIKRIEDQFALMAWQEAPGEIAIPNTRLTLQGLLLDHLKRARLKAAGPWFSISGDRPYDEKHLTVNIAVPVKLRPDQGPGDWDDSGVTLDWVEGSHQNASLIHQGSSTALPGVYSQLYGWIGQNGYQISGPCREIYLSELELKTTHHPSGESELIEIQCPIQLSPVPISLNPQELGEELLMEPTFTKKPAFQAIGISYIGKNENNEIPGTWDIFNKRYCEIPNNDDKNAYGLCFSTPDESIGELKPGEFEYVASTSVDEGAEVPSGMVYRKVPAYKYAVFTHHGKLDSLGETYKYIYETWVPQTDVKIHPDKFDMEVYTDEFIFDSDDSKFYIYVAVVD